MNKKEQILEILLEAKEYGLQWEVENTAKKLMKQGKKPVVAYLEAYDEWIK